MILVNNVKPSTSPDQSHPSSYTDPHHTRNVWGYLTLGLIFHLIYIMSIFDIYFKSPLVVDLPPIPPLPGPAPARRVVIFVGDGLRADKLYGNDPITHQPRAPFLRDTIARERGVWGVMHARVPTESRPGHVAMLAGMWEDVSAVTKGWKHNPVAYDHVFKRARRAWTMGADDILDLFTGPQVHAFPFPTQFNDFALDPRKMDQWTLERAKELFEVDANTNPTLKAQLLEDQVIFLVHLLGLDSNGHAHGPHSPEYADNIKLVDEGIRQLTLVMEKFYGNDKGTAHIFVSDHGMGDNWVHGDGHPDNTRCPLIAWGAGIDNPRPLVPGTSDPLMMADTYYWEKDGKSLATLADLRRRDIEQADLAPFIATLLGIPIPTNSVGNIPVSLFSSSSIDERWKILAALRNAHQLLVTVDAKEQSKARYEPFFRPFTYPVSQLRYELIQLEENIDKEELTQLQNHLTTLFKRIHAARHYYQTYDWLLLKVVIAVGFILWIIFSFLYIRELNQPNLTQLDSTKGIYKLFIIVGGGLVTFLVAKRAPPLYYAYFFFPWYFALRSALMWWRYDQYSRPDTRSSATNWWWFGAYAVGVELLTASFFWRPVISGAVLGIVVLVTSRKSLLETKKGKEWKTLGLIASLALVALFPLLPPINEPQPWIWTSGAIALVLTMVHLLYSSTLATPSIPNRSSSKAATTLRISNLEKIGRLALLMVAWLVSAVSDYRRRVGLSIPLVLPCLAWLAVGWMAIEPWWRRKRPHYLVDRLVLLFSSLAPGYLILSVSYEPLFLVALAWPLIQLVIIMEKAGYSLHFNSSTPRSNGQGEEVTLFLAFKLLVYILLSFFGTGNFASIASFSLPSVYRLITVFSPFTMSALLIGKVFIPIILFAALFGGLIQSMNRRNPAGKGNKSLISDYSTALRSVALWLVATIDLITINFFFLVRDTGSWMEIGTSISHFIIASVFSLIVVLIYGFSRLLLAGVEEYEKRGDDILNHPNLVSKTIKNRQQFIASSIIKTIMRK